MDFDFRTYYTSLTPTHRMDEEMIVEKAVDEGVIPIEVRYGVMQDAYRGVIKSSNEFLYYFHFLPNNDSFRLIKADDPSQIAEANRMLKAATLGCDLRKAEGVGGNSAGVSSIDEDDDVAQQDDLITDRHPGSAMATTPDDPAQGRMWHEQEIPPINKGWNAGSLLEGLNSNLRKSTEQLKRPISQKEHQFMVEVLGKTPDQIDRGDVYMNPTQKVMYQQWLGKSIKTKVGGLNKWLKK